MALRVVRIEARGLGLCTPAGCPLDKVLNQVRGLFVAEGKCWEGLSCEPSGPVLLWPWGKGSDGALLQPPTSAEGNFTARGGSLKELPSGRTGPEWPGEFATQEQMESFLPAATTGMNRPQPSLCHSFQDSDS